MSGEFPPNAALFVRKLGQAICRKRVVEGMTEIELAAAISVSVSTLHQIEAGKRKLRITMLVPIAAALNCMPNDLIELAAHERLHPDP
jgi:transcriptional regulator with XRE-family HTH domain